MKIPYLTRLMEIKEEQIDLEWMKLRLLQNILKELKGGLKNGIKNKKRKS